MVMILDKEKRPVGYIKKETLILAVLISLCIGFFGGTLYSSFKLAPANPVKTPGKLTAQKEEPHDHPDPSMELSAKIAELEQYLKNNPDNAEAWTNLGNLFYDSDQPQNAIDAYEKSLAIEPDRAGVMTDLGTMYRRNNEPKKAIEIFDKAIAVDPSFETARFNKGVVLLHDLNDLEGCIKEWEALVELNPMAVAPNGESVDAIIQKLKSRKSASGKENTP
jgi:cytochrome c-type biogenesis protein CcmH/NrfG